jgi:predicted RNA binding protein YcfA (HicA-like mRNA interferase family)
MKRNDLIKHIEKNGCEFLREGKKHTVYINRKKLKSSTIPRHREINDYQRRGVCVLETIKI